MMKTFCKKCKEIKRINEFKITTNGLRSSICIDCFTEKGTLIKQTNKNRRSKPRYKEYLKDWRKTPKGKFSKYKNRAKQSKLTFLLSLDEFIKIIKQPCTYCGDTENIGIDRINSNKGYILDNCTPCCTCCNRMKLDHSTDFFLAHIKKIIDFYN